MRLVKLGLGSVNTTVGAVGPNVDRALTQAEGMAREGVTLGLFPEQLVGGYPPEDLIQWQGFVEAQWTDLLRFARATSKLSTAFVVGVAVAQGGRRYNCGAVVAGGRILGLVPKEKLPTYNIFYEGRTFDHGFPGMAEVHRGVPLGDYLFAFDFGVLGVEICEDAWSPDGPMRRRTYSGAELIANLSGSPFRIGVQHTRKEMLATRAADYQCTLAYANMVGANDGLIFDGGGLVFQNGKAMHEAPRFVQGFTTTVVDLDRTLRLRNENTTWRLDRERWASRHAAVPTLTVPQEVFRSRREGLAYPLPEVQSFFLPAPRTPRPPRERYCEEILDALALGVGDYFEKNPAFKVLGISLSGGRDSLLTLLIAHRYARRARPDSPGSLLRAFYMGTRFSSAATQTAAETICRELDVPFKSLSIDEAFERELAAARAMLGPGEVLTPLTEQNIQARLRAQRMWNWSNSAGGMFLQTGNMSERAVGYTTIGGDLMGALCVIANVPKSVVMVLLDYLQSQLGLDGIRQVLASPAGPELAHNQVGEEELMPFPVLDACFYLFAEEKMVPDEVHATLVRMFPEISTGTLKAHVDKFSRLFLQSIYKWVQAPLSLHIGNLDLDRERALQLPVVKSNAWLNNK